MVQQDFEPSVWMERLGAALEALFPEVKALIRYTEVDSRGRRQEYSHWTQDDEFRLLAEDARHDPSARAAFESSSVHLDTEPVQAIEILRQHPVMNRVLTKPDDQRAVAFISPYQWLRVRLQSLVGNLAKLAMKTDGLNAASTFHRFLILGETGTLKAHEVTLFYGMTVNGRIDIADGAFLAPYHDVKAIYGPDPLEERNSLFENVRPLSPSCDPIPENAAAFVRQLAWGPAVISVEEEMEQNLRVKYQFSVDHNATQPVPPFTVQFPEDHEIVEDFLTIAMGRYSAAQRRYIRVEKWMETFDENVKFGWSSGSGSLNDSWSGHPLSEESTNGFLMMLDGWQSYGDACESLRLAVRRLAASRSRRGRLGVEDRVLDTAIALEIMYGPERGALTYKLKTRAAYFLGKSAKERKEISKKVGVFYDARSFIVHGKKGKPRVSLEEALAHGFEIAANTLRKLLRNGSVPDWDEVVLSGGENPIGLRDSG